MSVLSLGWPTDLAARIVVPEVADGRRFYHHELSSLESARPASNSGRSVGAFADRPSESPPLESSRKIMVDAALAVNPGYHRRRLSANSG